MGERSENKKQLIRDKARELFVERGFKDITMKDIVEACGISRGGLYLYYASTAEILKDILSIDASDSDEALAAAVRDNASPARILEVFFEEQKKELTSSKESLYMASYELASRKDDSERERLKDQFEMAARVLEELITNGVDSGDFYCPDPRSAARNIMYAIEGMKINSAAFGLSEKEIDDELAFLYTGLFYPEFYEEEWEQ